MLHGIWIVIVVVALVIIAALLAVAMKKKRHEKVEAEPDLRFPLFVKPLQSDGSAGIAQASRQRLAGAATRSRPTWSKGARPSGRNIHDWRA